MDGIRTRVLVREVMNSPVLVGTPDESADQLAKKMTERKAGSIVITKDGKPLGIVTQTDMVEKVLSLNKRPSEMKAMDMASLPLRTIEAEKDVTEAARQMRKMKVKRLGVVHDEELIGIISITDLSAIAPDLIDIVSEKARMIRGEVLRGKGPLGGYCDECSQWSDYLLDSEDRFLCERCRGERISDDKPS
ncbi:MAG: cyclic nucleotide-binding/CBS domain-containing protein [Nitrososphaerales archaeon]